LAEIPGLDRELREALNPAMVKRIEDAGSDGRLLVVSATTAARVFDWSPKPVGRVRR